MLEVYYTVCDGRPSVCSWGLPVHQRMTFSIPVHVAYWKDLALKWL